MKQKLSIAYISDAIYPYNKGGKEKRIFELTTRLAKNGHNVTIYTMKWWKEDVREKIEHGVRLYAISPLYPLYAGKRRSITQALLFTLACFRLLTKDFDVMDVDHMPHLILFPLKLVALIKRKKMYTTWNEVWGRAYWREYLGKLGHVAYLIEWMSARLPNVLVAVSTHTRDMLVQDLHVKQPVFVVPNGIDLSEIEKIKPAKEKSDIIFAGRLLSHKNVDKLLYAVAKVRDHYPHIQAYIIGNGPEKHNLEKLTRQLSLEKNVRFFDFFEDHTYLYALMKASKVFVFPSTREGFGITALEANASGIPVVTVNHKHNATRHLITNGSNGHVVSLDTMSLSKTIEAYLSPKKHNSSYSTYVRSYDWNVLSKQMEGVYSA